MKRNRVLFIFFLFLILSGIILRLCEYAYVYLQESNNTRSVYKKGTYSIMCIGGPTASQGKKNYSSYLEEILNKSGIGIKFKVIDLTFPIITVEIVDMAYILGHLEENLNRYKPDMIITLMGINSILPIPGEVTIAKKARIFINRLRLYKLVKLAFLKILNKSQNNSSCEQRRGNFISSNSVKNLNDNFTDRVQTNKDYAQVEKMLRKTIELNPENVDAYIALSRLYVSQEKETQAEELLKTATELNPKSSRAYTALGSLYERNMGLYAQAEEVLRKAIELDPKNEDAYSELSKVYIDVREYKQANDLLNKALELNPKSQNAYIQLGRYHLLQGDIIQADKIFKRALLINPQNDEACDLVGEIYADAHQFTKAEKIWKRAIELNPRNDEVYYKLAAIYRRQKNYSKAEELLKEAINLNSLNDMAYCELGKLYLHQGIYPLAEQMFLSCLRIDIVNYGEFCELLWFYKEKRMYKQAERLLKQIIESNPDSEGAYESLLLLYDDMGKTDKVLEYTKLLNSLRKKIYSSQIRDYKAVRRIVKKRGLRFVCVQYPMRNIDSLKKIFEGEDDDIIFIDNKNIFSEALKKSSYRDYFGFNTCLIDLCYCTPRGNKLIAENIVKVLLRGFFKK